jgi:hypothetical protein
MCFINNSGWYYLSFPSGQRFWHKASISLGLSPGRLMFPSADHVSADVDKRLAGGALRTHDRAAHAGPCNPVWVPPRYSTVDVRGAVTCT